MKNVNFPRIQAVPHPTKLVFQLDGAELVSYNYIHAPYRPYLFPVIGPSGRYLTRISHPHDPIGHRHHYSIWLAHHNINDVDFWSDSDKSGKQIHQNFLEFEDAPDFARMVAQVLWQTPDGKVLLDENKQITVRLLESKQYFIDMDLTFNAVEDIHFGKTNFGLLGVRVSKTMGVHDGGGNITNSEGDIDEEQVFGKRARWCDYSGPVTPTEWNGITIFDHPSNYDHPFATLKGRPVHWHVRNDGWMCPSLFFETALNLPAGQKLSVKYRLFVHVGAADVEIIEGHYQRYSSET